MILVKLLNILKTPDTTSGFYCPWNGYTQNVDKGLQQLKTDKHHSPLWNFF